MEQNEKISPDQIHQRKIELIKRDPLAHEWNKLKNCPQDGAIENRLENIGREIERKWSVALIPYPKICEPPLSGLRINAYPNHTVFDATKYIEEFTNSLRSHHKDLLERQGWVFVPTEGAYEHGNYIDKVYIPTLPGHIPLLIDAGGLTEKGVGKVLEQVKDILLKRIRERKHKGTKRWNPIPQIGDSPELGFIYSIQEKAFKRYIKWYDLHEEGFPFRTIAQLEYIEKERPSGLNEAKTILKGKTVGEPIKREDTVRKGFNLIYEAIHRKPYRTKARQKTYSCPMHSQDCPNDCTHMMQWLKEFNKRSRLKTLIPTGDAANIKDDSFEEIDDPEE